MSAGKADVLVAFRLALGYVKQAEAADRLGDHAEHHEDSRELIAAASAAAAELIEADREYDAARALWNDGAPSAVGESDTRSEDDPAWVRLVAARVRRAAALAAVQP